MKSDLIRRQERFDKSAISVALERAIYIIGAVALVVARLAPGPVLIDALGVNDRCDRIEECKRILARLRADRFGQRGRVTGPA